MERLMPSPFPGIDPYIESQRWSGFHVTAIGVLLEMLVPMVRPRYVVDPEERIYLHFEDETRVVRPDLFVADKPNAPARPETATATALAEPITITLPIPEEHRERRLAIRNREDHTLVTVIELLSPSNKRAGSLDQASYLEKRNDVLKAGASLVELDLLRGGERMPSDEPLPPADYYAIVCRAKEFPRASAFAWTLRQSLPTIHIPLAEGDPDVHLDLQTVYSTVYDRAGYDYSLDYAVAVEPPLTEEDRSWADEILRAQAI
jgi:hypothetical protein